MRRSLLLFIAAALAPQPAAAHPGDHVHLSLAELIAHYAEPDHLAFLALTVIVGWLAFHAGRRLEARLQTKRNETERRP
jgi:hypothetical protein